jgi:uncharacterized membrane protein (DUF2068 family)
MMITNTNSGSLTIGIVAVIYGLLALVASIGLWKMKPWAYNAFLSWGVLVLIFCFIYQLSIDGIPFWKFALFLLFISAILASVARYINRVLRVAL